MDPDVQSARFTREDAVDAAQYPVKQLSAKYDPRNREIHDDYMDWSIKVRAFR
jgi:hypothetical protein